MKPGLSGARKRPKGGEACSSRGPKGGEAWRSRGARGEESSPWRLKGGEVWSRISLGLKEGSLDLSGGLSLELVGRLKEVNAK